MADSMVAAVRELIVAGGLVGGRVWLDAAPEGATLPYVTLHPQVSDVPRLRGDGERLMRHRQDQVSLWESRRGEDSALTSALEDSLEGAVLSVEGEKFFRLAVDGTQRFADPGGQVVQRAFTLSVRHGSPV